MRGLHEKFVITEFDATISMRAALRDGARIRTYDTQESVVMVCDLQYASLAGGG